MFRAFTTAGVPIFGVGIVLAGLSAACMREPLSYVEADGHRATPVNEVDEAPTMEVQIAAQGPLADEVESEIEDTNPIVLSAMMNSLPAALREPIDGPALEIRAATANILQKAKAVTRRPAGPNRSHQRTVIENKPAKLQIHRRASDRLRVELVIGYPLRPQMIRVHGAGEFRVLVPSDPATLPLLRQNLQVPGLRVAARALGAHQIALELDHGSTWAFVDARATNVGFVIDFAKVD